ncbi:NACHT domain-containing NTPase [Tychonema sp. BBK16]|uniref:NACHT domain-containing protein n=1 Tax=Tychonema sp. BBK16 TaxID=2699888 RepID=UPI001F1A104E|nr:hypothetical protein [Tychonema sp. BBK16]MCF6373201.1 hypothetical protein [Tychonema sp. BBK16]
MPASGRTVWKEWGSKRLSKLKGEDFIAEISPLIRLFHPDLQSNNIYGTHLTVWSDSDITPYAIQCQGFDNLTLGIEQAKLVEEQINQFIQLGFCCDRYYVIHNGLSGFGGQQFNEFNNLVNDCLQRLLDLHRAREVRLLDRSVFIKEVSQRLENILEESVRKKSEEIKCDIQSRLRFSKYYIPGVPLFESQIQFRSFDLPNLGTPKNLLSKDTTAHQVVLSSSCKIRWTLLHGEPGTGKTTTALQAATQKGKTVLFVPCELFEFYDLQKGTSILLNQIVNVLGLLDDYFSDEDKEIILKFSGSTLANILEHSEDHALIFDGLDENRFYSDPNAGGLERLSSRLEDFDCPVILTTRTSHFKASFERFSQSLVNSPQPSHHRKNSRLLELSGWQIDQVVQLVDDILNDTENLTQKELERISQFRCILVNGDYYLLYNHLPCNPLFLQFILEEVIISGIRESNRISLIHHWVRSKIRRDLMVKARSFIVKKEVHEFESYIDKMLRLMEYVASKMIAETDEGYELKEYLEFSDIENRILEIFNIKSASLIDILLNSALTSQANLSRSHYRSSRERVTFVFKVFHEYFLACSLVRNSKKCFGYPDSVKEFYSEIKKYLKQDEDSDFARYLNKSEHQSCQDNDNAKLLLEFMNKLDGKLAQMSDSSKPSNQYNFNAPIHGPVTTGGEVKELNYTYNEYAQDPKFVQTLDDIKKSLENLRQNNASVSDDEYVDIIDAEFEDVRVNEPEKWASWMNVLQVLFSGGVEAAKAFNPWLGIPIEVLKTAYKIHREKHKSLPESQSQEISS